MRLGLFGQEVYMTTDLENVEATFSTRFEGTMEVIVSLDLSCIDLPSDWGLESRRLGLYPLLGERIFTQDGKLWRHSREIFCLPVFWIRYQKYSANILTIWCLSSMQLRKKHRWSSTILLQVHTRYTDRSHLWTICPKLRRGYSRYIR